MNHAIKVHTNQDGSIPSLMKPFECFVLGYYFCVVFQVDNLHIFVLLTVSHAYHLAFHLWTMCATFRSANVQLVDTRYLMLKFLQANIMSHDLLTCPSYTSH
jgi:hypothetical protein